MAAAAGVSVTTVTHSLNGKGRVEAATRQRVLETASRLGYAPSRAAQILRGAQTRTLALLLPPFSESTDGDQAISLDNYMRMVASAVSSAHRRRYALLLLPPEPSSADLRDAGMDGAVVVDPTRADRRLDLLLELGIPFVTVERDVARDLPWHVSLDADQAMRTTLEHLVEQGAGNVCLLAPNVEWAYSLNAVDAFRRLVPSYGIESRVITVPVARLEGGAYEMATLALDSRHPPDAFIALAERFAAGVVRAAGERNIAIPRDLLLVSGADSNQAREAHPTITALDMQSELAAEQAIEMLVDRVEKRPSEAPRILPYRLVVRESTLRQTTARTPPADAQQ